MKAMRKERVIGLFLLGLIVLASLSFFVSADDPPAPQSAGGEKTVGTTLWEDFGKLFSFDDDWNTFFDKPFFKLDNSNGSGGFAKLLVFLLVFLILYALTPILPFFDERNWVSFAVSAIVAILSTFWLTKQEIIASLLAYNALGLVITGIVPWFAIAVISKRAHEKGYPMISKVLWIAFSILVVVRLFSGITDYNLKWAYFIILACTFVMLLWEHKIFYLLYKATRKEFASALKEVQTDKLLSDAADLADRIQTNTRNNLPTNTLIAAHNRVAKELRKKGVSYSDWSG